MGGSVGPSAETWTFLGPVRHRRIAVVRTLSPNWRDSPDTLSGNLGAVQPRQLTKSRGCMSESSIGVRPRRRLRTPRSAPRKPAKQSRIPPPSVDAEPAHPRLTACPLLADFWTRARDLPSLELEAPRWRSL